MKRIIFEIDRPSEPSAGIIGSYDQITVVIDSGDPGGEPGEFEKFMIEALEEWFDGAKVGIL